MKTTIIFLFFAVSCTFAAAQHLHRVNNNGFDADFTTLSAAVAAAAAGDTIYLEGSATAYDGCSVNKQLTIIGPGYFLGENPKTQAMSLEAKFNTELTFASGSAGSTIMGCYFNSYIELVIAASNISIIRNYLYDVSVESTVSDISILQNYINGDINCTNPYAITNSVISNNYIDDWINIGSNSGGIIITNNIMKDASISVYNSTIQNNIIANTGYEISELTGNSISYNILAKTGTNANNNQYGVDMTTVFIDFNGSLDYSTDGKWQLAASSPAIAAGSGGVDCGIFGGISPYVFSGVPNLPHIYEADVPAAVSSGSTLGISIKVKSGD